MEELNIWIAAGNGDLEGVKGFLANGVDVNAKDAYGYTPLQAAVSYSQTELAKYLLDNGASSTLGDNDMDTPLHHCETVECAQLLLQYGADINARNNEGQTPYDAAIDDDREELMAMYKGLGAQKSDSIPEEESEDVLME